MSRSTRAEAGPPDEPPLRRNMQNLEPKTVAGFGQEWSTFDQSNLDSSELRRLFDAYFLAFPWEKLPKGAVGVDVGCGSGRWDRLLAPRVGWLHCVDASAEALDVARRNLKDISNVTFHHASVDRLPFEPRSLDFAVSLGVLHHVPDTAAAIRACAACLKPGAPLLVYLYYRFDNRPVWFRALWRASDLGRRVIARLPFSARLTTSNAIAVLAYLPLARLARSLERLGFEVAHLPLSEYRDRTFYSMRTDALDRFGTRLERRFTRSEIDAMLREAGLGEVRFADGPPFWCASAVKM